MSAVSPHIDVCICTYRRPRLLQRLLEALCDLETEGRFTYAIVIADNDRLESSRILAAAFAAEGRLPIWYCVEPRQNIALARNKAVEHAKGDFLAFIDDDEFPTRRWLLNLFETCLRYEASGALGPVKPHFDEAPPRVGRRRGLLRAADVPDRVRHRLAQGTHRQPADRSAGVRGRRAAVQA